MGTNYYLYQKDDCQCCGRPFPELHIGKSSGGWCFALHVIPHENINSLDDWRRLWSEPGAYIRDEYDHRIPITEMEKIITERSWKGDVPIRHTIDGFCIGHGEGTWDLLDGEFT